VRLEFARKAGPIGHGNEERFSRPTTEVTRSAKEFALAEETTPAAESAANEKPRTDSAPISQTAPELGPKIKTRKPKQRACDEKNDKGKLCAGHLKRWFDFPSEVAALVGKGAEVYRCEFCKTIYRPDPKQQPNSYTVRY
jgi:hypothetical protein